MESFPQVELVWSAAGVVGLILQVKEAEVSWREVVVAWVSSFGGNTLASSVDNPVEVGLVDGSNQ